MNNYSAENFFTILLKTNDASFISYVESKYPSEIKESKKQIEKKQLRDAEFDNTIDMLEIAASIQDELKKPDSIKKSLSLMKKKIKLESSLEARKDIMDKLAQDHHDSGNASSSDEECAAAADSSDKKSQKQIAVSEHKTENSHEELSWGDKLARDIASQHESTTQEKNQEYFVNMIIASDFQYLEELIGPAETPYKDSCLGEGWKDIIDDPYKHDIWNGLPSMIEL